MPKNNKENNSPDKITEIVEYIYESGLLKKYKRTGWWVAGIKDPETIAEHSFRSSLIAYILATMEGANPEKTACMMIFHDIPEARFGDLHKIATHYLDIESAEKEAEKDQLVTMPEQVKNPIQILMREYNEKNSKEAIIAKDADYLECAFQAREYLDIGYKATNEWITSIEPLLKTNSAKKIFQELKKQDSKQCISKIRKRIKSTKNKV